MKHPHISCPDAREQLSALQDGELAEPAVLRLHLEGCAVCREHEHALAALARGFDGLREPGPVRDLWPAIERRARPAPAAPRALLRLAAALVGFVGLGGAALVVERGRAPDPGRHLFERLGPVAGPDALFASLPEYRILRALPGARPEEPR